VLNQVQQRDNVLSFTLSLMDLNIFPQIFAERVISADILVATYCKQNKW